MRHLVVVLALAGCAGALLGGCGEAPSRPNDHVIEIGTGGTGGVYYPLGVAIAGRLARGDTLRSYLVETTGGSLENIRRVLRGDLDLGFAISTTVFEAYAGGQDFDAPQTRLRIVSPLYPNLSHLLVSTASGIEGVADLRGRAVSVGSAGSGTEQVSRHLLEAYGLDYTMVEQRFFGFDASVAALRAGEIDAAILSVGLPAPAVTDVLATGEAHLVPLDAEHVRMLADRYPYYSQGVIPAETYPAQPRDVPTLLVLNWIVARDDLDADVAYAILDMLNSERELLREAVGIDGQINPANLLAAPIPLHPAVRAWLGRGAAVDTEGVP